jgi:hypothetical protein
MASCPERSGCCARHTGSAQQKSIMPSPLPANFIALSPRPYYRSFQFRHSIRVFLLLRGLRASVAIPSHSSRFCPQPFEWPSSYRLTIGKYRGIFSCVRSIHRSNPLRTTHPTQFAPREKSPNPFRIRTSTKPVRNSSAIRTYKFIRLKVL